MITSRPAGLKAILSTFASGVRPQPTTLLSLDEAKRGRAFAGQARGGIQQVSLDRIVGSVNRAGDFDANFNLRSGATRERWARVNQAYHDDVTLPPVQLQKVGEDYFIIDGHHRVSVAKHHRMDYIDAEVFEYTCASLDV